MISCSKLDTMYPWVMETAASRPSGMCRLGACVGGKCLFLGVVTYSVVSAPPRPLLGQECWRAGAGGFSPPGAPAVMKPLQAGFGEVIYHEGRSFFFNLSFLLFKL